MFETLPSEEDSPDLTDEEVESARVSKDVTDFVKTLYEEARASEGRIRGHELRRRAPYLYSRTRIAFPTGPDRVIMFRLEWLTGG